MYYYTHHFLELFHFEVIYSLGTASLDLFPWQKTSSLMSLKNRICQQLAYLLWVWKYDRDNFSSNIAVGWRVEMLCRASPFWTLCKYMFSVWGVKGSGGVGLQVVVESIQPSCGDPSMVLGSPCSCLMFILGRVRGLLRWPPAGLPGAPGGFRPEIMSGQLSGQDETKERELSILGWFVASSKVW